MTKTALKSFVYDASTNTLHTGIQTAKIQPRKRSKRGFDSAAVNRLTAGWLRNALSSNAEVQKSLGMLRSRSLDLYRNSDYIKKFVKMLRSNVVGPQGILCQSKVRDNNGALDTYANGIIDREFALFSRAVNFDVTGKLSRAEAERLYIQTVALNGEAFVRKVRNYSASRHKFAVQFIDPALVPETLTIPDRNIQMGIQFDEWGRPVAYYVLKDAAKQTSPTVEACTRIPADEMLHAFLAEFPGQLRGVPWTHTTILRLQQLGEFEKASLVAAIVGSSQAGFFEQTDETGGGSVAGMIGEEDDDFGGLSLDVQAGTFTALPRGVTFKPYTPSQPNGNVGQFLKSMLRGVSSGLGVSYNMLSSDMEGVSYSSIRSAQLEERDTWRELQAFVRDTFLIPVFEAWLDSALMHGLLGSLPYSKFDKFNSPVWRARGFTWIDPQSEATANDIGLKNGSNSLTRVLGEQGIDVEEHIRQLAEERALLEKYGVTLGEAAAKAKEVAIRPDPTQTE